MLFLPQKQICSVCASTRRSEAGLERVYAQNGLSLTDAVNVFFQQSLNAGGLPFQVTEDNAALIQAKALSRLMKELEAGLTDPVSYSEDDVYRMLGVEKEA